MKALVMILALSAFAGPMSLADSPDRNDNGYRERLSSGYHGYRGQDGCDYVYLNSPSDYRGAGEVESCQKVSTYQGGPKTGSMRTYYVCKIINN